MKNDSIEHAMKELAKSDEQLLEESRNFRHKYLQEPGNIDGRCAIFTRFVTASSPKHYQLVFQIFHTDVKKLSSRSHLLPVDGDLRRPMFMTGHEDSDKVMTYLQKNAHLFRAYEMTSIDQVAGESIVFQQISARSQSELHFFVAWKHYCEKPLRQAVGAKDSPPAFCTGVVDDVPGREPYVRCMGLLTPEQFTAVLNKEMTLTDCGISLEKPDEWDSPDTTLTTNDGRVISRSEMEANTREQYQKEVLKAAEPTTTH